VIIKERDSISDDLQQLEESLRSTVSYRKRQWLEKDLAQRRAGLRGEQTAAYHIDFHLKNYANWAVLHDLRIECKGRVAQIDHLLISRLLEIYVVESKSFHTKIRYANGGWERLNYNHWEGIACPVQQNERHIAVLKDLITEKDLAIPRFGFTMMPKFYNVVVVMPTCSIIGDHPENAKIYRMDKLVDKVRKEDPAALHVFKIISAETLTEFACKLAAHHCPASRSGYHLSNASWQSAAAKAATLANQQCQGCGGALQTDEGGYCRQNSRRFCDQLLCRKCQDYAPKLPLEIHDRNSTEQSKPVDAKAPSKCSDCGRIVDQKVAAYCQERPNMFNGRIYCRACQPAHRRATVPLSTLRY
jgi:nuclease-like protein